MHLSVITHPVCTLAQMYLLVPEETLRITPTKRGLKVGYIFQVDGTLMFAIFILVLFSWSHCLKQFSNSIVINDTCSTENKNGYF